MLPPSSRPPAAVHDSGSAALGKPPSSGGAQGGGLPFSLDAILAAASTVAFFDTERFRPESIATLVAACAKARRQDGSLLTELAAAAGACLPHVPSKVGHAGLFWVCSSTCIGFAARHIPRNMFLLAGVTAAA